jgi:hypothetical protein
MQAKVEIHQLTTFFCISRDSIFFQSKNYEVQDNLQLRNLIKLTLMANILNYIITKISM